MTISASRGSSTSTSLRLCSRAPEMTIRSEAGTATDSTQANRCSPGGESGEFVLYVSMRDKMRAQRAVARLAARQHGVVSASQLRELGYPGEKVSRSASNGALHRVHRGVYAVGHSAVSRQGICLGAVLACGERALLSHSAAAWLWGLEAKLPRPVEVTAPTPRHARASIRIHSAATLREVDRETVERIPVTAVPRTILDLAGARRAPSPQRLLARAKRLGLLDLVAFDSLLADSSGQRGAHRLRQALADFRYPPFTRPC